LERQGINMEIDYDKVAEEFVEEINWNASLHFKTRQKQILKLSVIKLLKKYGCKYQKEV
jgi:hypothetical protein